MSRSPGGSNLVNSLRLGVQQRMTSMSAAEIARSDDASCRTRRVESPRMGWRIDELVDVSGHFRYGLVTALYSHID
jgi:hypothetical protein